MRSLPSAPAPRPDLFQFYSTRCVLTDQVTKATLAHPSALPPSKPVDWSRPPLRPLHSGGLLHPTAWRSPLEGPRDVCLLVALPVAWISWTGPSCRRGHTNRDTSSHCCPSGQCALCCVCCNHCGSFISDVRFGCPMLYMVPAPWACQRSLAELSEGALGDLAQRGRGSTPRPFGLTPLIPLALMMMPVWVP